VLYRDEAGFTQAECVSKIRGVKDFVEHGAKLGHLWMEGHFRVGDPLTRAGERLDVMPKTGGSMHIELLVEEASAEAALTELLPRCVTAGVTWAIHVHQGKQDLLSKLANRLKGYAHWLPNDWYIVVLLDNDREDCHHLKNEMERVALEAALQR